MVKGQASRVCDPALKVDQPIRSQQPCEPQTMAAFKTPNGLITCHCPTSHNPNLTVHDLFFLRCAADGLWRSKTNPACLLSATKPWQETMEGHCWGLEIIITMTAPIFIVATRLTTAAPKCFVINRKSCSLWRINSTSLYWVSHGGRFHCFPHCVADTGYKCRLKAQIQYRNLCNCEKKHTNVNTKVPEFALKKKTEVGLWKKMPF